LTGTFYITPLKLLVAALLFVFSFLEIFPNLTKLEIKDKWIPFGGLLSGFFGGISGHQGALRTAFLSKAGLHKEGFIATGVVVAVLVDVSRLSVYSEKLFHRSETIDYGLLICSTGCAFVGAFAGNKLLRKITFKTLQIIVAIMLMFFSILLSLGIV
jgi:uncharacterized membrane protein YfcA